MFLTLPEISLYYTLNETKHILNDFKILSGRSLSLLLHTMQELAVIQILKK